MKGGRLSLSGGDGWKFRWSSLLRQEEEEVEGLCSRFSSAAACMGTKKDAGPEKSCCISVRDIAKNLTRRAQRTRVKRMAKEPVQQNVSSQKKFAKKRGAVVRLSKRRQVVEVWNFPEKGRSRFNIMDQSKIHV